MDQAVTIQAQTGVRPAIISGLPRNTISIMKMHIERRDGETFLPPNDLPTGELRAKMIERGKTLKASLAPAGPDAVKPEIVAIFATMGCRAGDTTDAAIIQRIYAEDLADLPLFAVREACSDFRKKIVGDGRWAPSQGDIRERALKHAKQFSDELADLAMLIRAKPLAIDKTGPTSPEERAKAVARVRGMAKAAVDASAMPKNERAILQAGGKLDQLGMAKPAADKRTIASAGQVRAEAEENLRRLERDQWTPQPSPHLVERLAR